MQSHSAVPKELQNMVAYTDKLIGKLIAKLEELKLRDNTVVLILGDNGGCDDTGDHHGGDRPFGRLHPCLL